MRGPFSIEWLAQSSRTPLPLPGPPGPPGPPDPAGPAASHSESLPGFYCRHKPEAEPPVPEGCSRASDVSSSSGADSDYESEGRRSLSPSRRPARPSAAPASPASPASPQCARRSRTAFTAEQISCLEKSFKRSAYLGTQDKAELCKKLSLSDKQVRNWFQNRRMKMKRSMQDALAQACQATSTSQLLLYSDLQAYRARVYHRYPTAAAPEGPALAQALAPAPAPAPAAPYGPPQALQYASSLDSFCQYSSFPVAPHYRAAYPNYPHYY